MRSGQELDFTDEFQQAMDELGRGTSLFVTGKAGTGKSTLLRYFLDSTHRRTAVVAPTGVAALNVGGQTIHRLFSFPASMPHGHVQSPDYFPRYSLDVLRSLEVLVVDEVSMVRADLLDAMDGALRRFGPAPGQPFGGVQMVFVGDPYQLPPVVEGDDEQQYFRSRYATPFFFSADAFRDLDYQVVELTRVFRQSDSDFVELLNAVRTGDAAQSEFDRLNACFDPGFEPPDDEFWITLTTTNRMADEANRSRLDRLDSPLLTHRAQVEGDVREQDKPTAEQLEYKVGAQVMMLTNDPVGRWVNGSMGVVVAVRDGDGEPLVGVHLLEAGELHGRTVWVSPFTWEVTRPQLVGGRLTREVVGRFTQLPFRLAWAVTIHKSQGKTLDRVVVSLGRGTFADGQLYVALSRCRSLDGLVLKSQVKGHHVKVEREVTRFLARHRSGGEQADGRAFVGVLSTGMGALDRLLEVAVVIERDGEVEEYSTLLNPLRDIGEAAGRFGITAGDLSMAPTLDEAWPVFARRMEGCLVVSHGLPLVQTMVERELAAAGMRVDLGLGVDTQELLKAELEDAAAAAGLVLTDASGALARARATAAVYGRADGPHPVTSPYRPGEEVRRFGRTQSRDAVAALPATGGDPELAYADHVVHTVGLDAPVEDCRRRLAERAAALGLSPEQVSRLHSEALSSAVVAAARDGVTSEQERGHLVRAAAVLGLPEPVFNNGPSEAIADALGPGVRVCFTGTAYDADGGGLERSDLEAMANAAGLVTVDSLTKKGCDVLIAADASSMSGKAKNARKWGKPVHSVAEFLDWLPKP